MKHTHETPKSSNVARSEYDDQTRVLTVHFHSGGVYDYADVPPEKWNGLRGSDSPGKFINTHIKPSHGAARRKEVVK